ncbi:hypothetical protein ACFO4N_05790 [Camelliibacillus cellulosilyticus]|uniref:Uncharacterized protein n=1 Tax=Camelliibacillus cellulosilyticus TaxID=2174486 RepID=A0ABV9GIY4_9BACL
MSFKNAFFYGDRCRTALDNQTEMSVGKNRGRIETIGYMPWSFSPSKSGCFDHGTPAMVTFTFKIQLF